MGEGSREKVAVGRGQGATGEDNRGKEGVGRDHGALGKVGGDRGQ